MQIKDAKHTRVISRFGQQADILLPSGEIQRARIRKQVKHLVTGDRVEVEPAKTGELVVTKRLERFSELTRSQQHGNRTIAANVHAIWIIVAHLPLYSRLMIDKLLVLASHNGLSPKLIANKKDLQDDATQQEMLALLSEYESLGISTAHLSASDNELDFLLEELQQQTVVLVGQSGVGKSTLINALIQDAEQSTGALSDLSDLGQHTTTTSKLFRTRQNGLIIDSPGIRDAGLWHLTRDAIQAGFIEMPADECRFRDCKHLNEPGCVVRERVKSGEILESRYQNYCLLMEAARVD